MAGDLTGSQAQSSTLTGSTAQSSSLAGSQQAVGTVTGATENDGALGGASGPSGAVTEVSKGGTIEGSTAFVGEIAGATRHASTLTGGSLGGTIESGVRGGDLSGAQGMLSTLSGGLGGFAAFGGGFRLAGTVTGGLAFAMALKGSTEQASELGEPFIPGGLDDVALDVQYKILAADQAKSAEWAVTGTNQEVRTIYAYVPWPMMNGVGGITWEISGFYSNTSGATTEFDVILYREEDVTGFYGAHLTGLPFAASTGTFVVRIHQGIFNFGTTINQDIDTVGLFNPGPIVALGGAGHGPTTRKEDMSRNTAGCAFNVNEGTLISLAVKKPNAHTGVTIRTDRIVCAAWCIRSGFTERGGAG